MAARIMWLMFNPPKTCRFKHKPGSIMRRLKTRAPPLRRRPLIGSRVRHFAQKLASSVPQGGIPCRVRVTRANNRGCCAPAHTCASKLWRTFAFALIPVFQAREEEIKIINPKSKTTIRFAVPAVVARQSGAGLRAPLGRPGFACRRVGIMESANFRPLAGKKRATIAQAARSLCSPYPDIRENQAGAS